MESHRRGDLTEAIVIAELKRREIPVSMPFGDNERYDLIVETEEGKLLRMQVKTGWMSHGKIQFHGSSQHTNSSGNVYKPYDGEVDHFIVYCYELDTMYLIPEDSFDTAMSLRVEPPERSDRSIRWADDYEFDRQWPHPDADRERPSSPSVDLIERVVDEFRQEGHTVAHVVGDGGRDLLAETSEHRYARVRIKPGWKVDGRIRFNPDRWDGVDFVVVYWVETDKLYVVPTSEFDKSISLRVDDPVRCQPTINWAEDYEFPEQWP